MLQCLRLFIWLLLSAAVNGREYECDRVAYEKYCFDAQTLDFVKCWGCVIENQQITDDEITIFPKHVNGTAVDVTVVLFSGGNILTIPQIKSNSKETFEVNLFETNTRVLNSQLFGNATQNLRTFISYENNLSVESSAFQNCPNLEYLRLSNNSISSLAPDTFIGLHKLIQLSLSRNDLTEINADWFDDLNNLKQLILSGNQLSDIPDNAFENLLELQLLDLNSNQIEIVRRKMFQHNRKLLRLDIYINRIKVIESGSFLHLDKLTSLDLRLNECTSKAFYNQTSEVISAALTECLPTICLIPLIANGYIVSIEENSPQTVGDSSEQLMRVKVVCNKSYSLFHERANQTENWCQNEVWISEKWAECHRE